jgi:GDP-mannose 4,6 dehydratase
MTASSPQPGRQGVVTGGAGFLGSHLCERLVARGIRVICADNFITASAANVSHLTASPLFTLINRDITEGLDISGPVEYVFHLASPASPADYRRFPVQTQAGSLGTIRALELAGEKRARFVLASSSEVYGDPLEHPQRESCWGNVNPVGPRSPYDEAKRFAEATTAAYARTYGVSSAIARVFNSYGPRMRPGDGRAVPTFIRLGETLPADPPVREENQRRQGQPLAERDPRRDRRLRLPHRYLPRRALPAARPPPWQAQGAGRRRPLHPGHHLPLAVRPDSPVPRPGTGLLRHPDQPRPQDP